MNDIPYKVLWVDDDESIVLSTQTIAEDYNIYIEHFTNWENAYEELVRNFDDYSAIILDAYCKVRAEQIETELFITSILPEMIGLFGRKQKDIPWYILSAGTMNQFNFVVKSALLSREEKNEEWGDMLYIKGSPEHEKSQKKLFVNIKRIAEQKGLNIVLHRYAKIFKYMGDGKLISSKARRIMLKMLCAFYYPEDYVNYEFEANPLRKVIEYLFRAARKVGLLPEECFDDNKSAINISEASLYMSGKNTKHINVRYGYGNEKNKDGSGGDTILAPRTANALWNVIKFVNAGSHTEDDIILYTNAKDEPYIVDDESKELFFGYVLHICHVIKSFGEYYEHHSDIMANKAMKRNNFFRSTNKLKDAAK